MEIKQPSEMTLEEIIIKIWSMAIATVQPGKDPHDANVVRQDTLKWASFELNERIELAVKAGKGKVYASQEGIRDVFDVGQKVLVRSGIDWRTREIQRITVLRHDVNCPHCGISLLGEPRFWFTDWGNVSLENIMARADIDPGLVRGVRKE